MTAQRRAQDYCKDTCPQVEKAFGDFIRAHHDQLPPCIEAAINDELIAAVLDQGAGKLRDALIEACRDLNRAEDEAEDLRRQLLSASDELADLKARIRELESEVA